MKWDNSEVVGFLSWEAGRLSAEQVRREGYVWDVRIFRGNSDLWHESPCVSGATAGGRSKAAGRSIESYLFTIVKARV